MSALVEQPLSLLLGVMTLIALPNAKNEPSASAAGQQFASGKTAATAYYVTHTDRYNIEHRMLFDSGLGGPDANQDNLAAALHAAGLDASSPNEAYFSHLRADCVASYFRDGKPLLAAARHDFCTNDIIYGDPTPENETRVAALMETLGNGLGDRAGGYTPRPKQAGVIVYDFASGFTPGHSVFYLNLGGNVRLAFIGELVRFAPTQLEHPELSVADCFDAGADAASRKAVLDTIVDNGWFVAGTHLPFPGIGTIAREDTGYAFTPASAETINAAVTKAKKCADAAPTPAAKPTVAKVTLIVKNHASADITLAGDPNWDDQAVKYNGRHRKKPVVLKPGKSCAMSVDWNQPADELMMGVCIAQAGAEGLLSLTVGHADGTMTITENSTACDPKVGYTIVERVADSVVIEIVDA